MPFEISIPRGITHLGVISTQERFQCQQRFRCQKREISLSGEIKCVWENYNQGRNNVYFDARRVSTLRQISLTRMNQATVSVKDRLRRT
jgi:hypothetical protein